MGGGEPEDGRAQGLHGDRLVHHEINAAQRIARGPEAFRISGQQDDGLAGGADLDGRESTERFPWNSVRDLERPLAMLGTASTPAASGANTDLVDAIGESGRLIPLLRSISNDETLLREIAGRSYQHSNHFDKIVLIDSADPNK